MSERNKGFWDYGSYACKRAYKALKRKKGVFIMHGKFVGYHRTSTKEQNLGRGVHEIMEYCRVNNIALHRAKVYTDQSTGKDFERHSYNILKEEVLEEGDCLIITEIDRLGRNKDATLKEITWLKENNIRLMVLELPTTLVDLDTMNDNEMATMMLDTINNIMIELYASLAHAEMEKRVKRQREGIELMKRNGDWDKYGRPRTMKQDTFNKLYQAVLKGEIKPFDFMKKHGISKSCYYRYRKEYERSMEQETGKQ